LNIIDYFLKKACLSDTIEETYFILIVYVYNYSYFQNYFLETLFRS